MRDTVLTTMLIALVFFLAVSSVQGAPRVIAEEEGYHAPLYTNNIERYLDNDTSLTIAQDSVEFDGSTAILDTSGGSTDLVSALQPIRLDTGTAYVQFNGGTVTTDATGLTFDTPIALESGTQVSAVEMDLGNLPVPLDAKVPTSGAVKDHVATQIQNTNQDLGYNNNVGGLSLPGTFAEHEVTITNGSNTNIRDYYAEDDQSLILSSASGNQYFLNITEGFGVTFGKSAKDACSATNEYLDGVGNCDVITGGNASGNGTVNGTIGDLEDTLSAGNSAGFWQTMRVNTINDVPDGGTLPYDDHLLLQEPKLGSAGRVGVGMKGEPAARLEVKPTNTSTGLLVDASQANSNASASFYVNGSRFVQGGNGRVTNDGDYDGEDVLAITDYMEGKRNLTPSEFARADLDGDGRVTYNEATLIGKDVIGGNFTESELQRMARRQASSMVRKGQTSEGEVVVGIGGYPYLALDGEQGLFVNGSIRTGSLHVSGSRFVQGGSGDIDGDGHAGTDDALDILDYLDGERNLTPSEFARADLNGDGRVTYNEASLIVGNTVYDWEESDLQRKARRQASNIVRKMYDNDGEAIVGIGADPEADMPGGLLVNGSIRTGSLPSWADHGFVNDVNGDDSLKLVVRNDEPRDGSLRQTEITLQDTDVGVSGNGVSLGSLKIQNDNGDGKMFWRTGNTDGHWYNPVEVLGNQTLRLNWEHEGTDDPAEFGPVAVGTNLGLGTQQPSSQLAVSGDVETVNDDDTLYLPGGRSDVTGMTQFVKSISGNGNDYSVPTTSAVANYTGGGGNATNDTYLPDDPANSSVDMNNHQIGSLADPSSPGDAVTKRFLEFFQNAFCQKAVPVAADGTTNFKSLLFADNGCEVSIGGDGNPDIVIKKPRIFHSGKRWMVKASGTSSSDLCKAFNFPSDSSTINKNTGIMRAMAVDNDESSPEQQDMAHYINDENTCQGCDKVYWVRCDIRT